MRIELKGLNTQQIMSKIGRANERNRPDLEELQQRKKRKLLEHNRLRPTVVTAESSGKEHICFYNGHRPKNRDEAISLVPRPSVWCTHSRKRVWWIILA